MSELEQAIGNGATTIVPSLKQKASPRHLRFLRLAPGRVQRALDALEQIARLSVPKNEYSDQEATQIIIALRNQINEVEQRLSRAKLEKKIFSFVEVGTEE